MNGSNQTRRNFLKSVGAGAAGLVLGGCGDSYKQAHKPGKGPNILIIIADDLGWADVGYHGSDILTPNIDRLAGEGVRLEQHYVQPMCTPTRTALLTGRYPSRYGGHAIAPSNQQVLPFGTVTLASSLKSCGYRTAISGKWHLGSKGEWGPLKYGFDHSYGCLAGGVGQYNHFYKKGPYSRTWHRNDRLVDEQGHSTDLIAREAVGWIQAFAKTEEPFFVYVPFTAVHVPVEVPQKWIDMYGRKKFYDDPAKDESFKRYAAYVTHMDSAIGRLIDALERTGRRKDTLVVFASDNGSFPSWKPRGKYPGTHKACPVLGSNLPFRGYKAQLYEGGIRVPAVANWPGKLTSREVKSPLHIVDWMPTICRLVGYEPAKDLEWDGQNIWQVLTGEVSHPEARTFYWKFSRGSFALRDGDWKLIILGKDKSPELYNLAEDPYEEQNLAENHPDHMERLMARLAEHRKQDL